MIKSQIENHCYRHKENTNCNNNMLGKQCIEANKTTIVATERHFVDKQQKEKKE